MKADDAKRLKELEAENARLKKLVANQALGIDMLKESSSDAPIDVKCWVWRSRHGGCGPLPGRGSASGSG